MSNAADQSPKISAVGCRPAQIVRAGPSADVWVVPLPDGKHRKRIEIGIDARQDGGLEDACTRAASRGRGYAKVRAPDQRQASARQRRAANRRARAGS